jgi:hypothetical protein
MAKAAVVAFIGASTCWADALSTHRIPAALAFEAATETVANTRTREDLVRPGLAGCNNLAGSPHSFDPGKSWTIFCLSDRS